MRKKVKKVRFTFKRIIPRGQWAYLEPQQNYEIKLNGNMVGLISEITGNSFRKVNEEDIGKYNIRFMVYKTNIEEDGNPNCDWRWIQLKATFDTPEDAKDLILRNAEHVVKHHDLRWDENE